VPGRHRAKASLARIALISPHVSADSTLTRGRCLSARPFRDRGVVCQGTRIPGCSRHAGARHPSV